VKGYGHAQQAETAITSAVLHVQDGKRIGRRAAVSGKIPNPTTTLK
jgi:hypothetical protein